MTTQCTKISIQYIAFQKNKWARCCSQAVKHFQADQKVQANRRERQLAPVTKANKQILENI